MRIERTLISLERLESFDLSKLLLDGFGGQTKSRRLELLPTHETLPAAIASDPITIGGVVGRREDGSTTLLALTFDGIHIGHYEIPTSTDSILVPVEVESSHS